MFLQRFRRRRSLGAWGIGRAIQDALREDRLGQGIPVEDPALAAELDRARGTGRPLPGWLADAIGRRLGCDLGDVRVHAGERVDRLTARFGSPAFCVGSDIFLNRRALDAGGTSLTFEVLCHELAHLAHAIEPGRVRCWGSDDHEKLTEEACAQFSEILDQVVKIEELHLSKAEMIKGLKIACSNMDIRGRIFHPLDTARYGLGYYVGPKVPIIGRLFPDNTSLADVPIVGAVLAKGEGPRHGEGKDYTDAEVQPNIEENLVAQQDEISDAAENFTFDAKHDFDDWIGTKRGSFMALNEKEWIKGLANALHIAQDRACHREGRRGFGHTDPRVLVGWSPDDPDNDDHHGHDGEPGYSWWVCNKAAYNRAFNNSCEVLSEFLERIGFGPLPKWKHRSEEHAGWLTASDPLGCSELHRRRSVPTGPLQPDVWASTYDWPKGCYYGRRPGPIDSA